jgi:hypothetical protein
MKTKRDYTKHPLYKPAVMRMEEGAYATTVRNRIFKGAAIPAWAIKGAKLRAPAKKVK